MGSHKKLLYQLLSMFISKPQRKQILWLTFSRTPSSLKPRSQASLEGQEPQVFQVCWQYTTVLEICRDLPPFWNSSLHCNSSSRNLSYLKKINFIFAENFLWNLSCIKNFQIFFIELEYHRKLDFLKVKYPKRGRSLHI